MSPRDCDSAHPNRPDQTVEVDTPTSSPLTFLSPEYQTVADRRSISSSSFWSSHGCTRVISLFDHFHSKFQKIQQSTSICQVLSRVDLTSLAKQTTAVWRYDLLLLSKILFNPFLQLMGNSSVSDSVGVIRYDTRKHHVIGKTCHPRFLASQYMTLTDFAHFDKLNKVFS